MLCHLRHPHARPSDLTGRLVLDLRLATKVISLLRDTLVYLQRAAGPLSWSISNSRQHRYANIARIAGFDLSAGFVNVLINSVSEKILGVSIIGIEVGERICVFIAFIQSR